MRLAEVLLVALVAVPAAMAATFAATPAARVAQASAHWTPIESRIENDYFQQDAAGLVALSATLSGGGTAAAIGGEDGEWRSYYSALAAYRLAVLARSNETRAWPFAQRCVDELNRALATEPLSAEALALQSTCLALQSSLDPWRSPFAAAMSRARGDKALKVAPENPRVLLLAALAVGERPVLFGGDSQQAFVLMQRAVAAFERQGGRAAGLPGWGAAEAFTDLAQDYLTRGEALAARNVLERALLLAPDFAQARRLMAQIVSG